ncbi:MAG: YceI family protein [Pseudomonadota bacterium]
MALVRTAKLACAGALIAGLPLLAGGAAAEGWKLSGEESKIAFGSIKNNEIGEVHHFGGLSGMVDEKGVANIEIDVLSVETHIDIRNERMGTHALSAESHPKAKLSATVDMAALESLAPGETMTLETDATLSLGAAEAEVTAPLFIARLDEDRVMVSTDEMIMLHTWEIGIDDGITALREIAGLDSIARAAPVTIRLVFTREGKGA